jgi:hypothetical protein
VVAKPRLTLDMLLDHAQSGAAARTANIAAE